MAAERPARGDGGDAHDDRYLRLLMSSQDRIYAFILVLVPNRHDADDLMQETVTWMWRKFDTFEPGTNFVAWGIAIARRRIMKFFDRHRRSRIRFSDEVLEAIEEETKSSLDGMDHFLAALSECVQKLDEADRRVIRMRYHQKIPTQQIADLLGSSVYVIYRSLARIHKALEACVRRTLTREELA